MSNPCQCGLSSLHGQPLTARVPVLDPYDDFAREFARGFVIATRILEGRCLTCGAKPCACPQKGEVA